MFPTARLSTNAMDVPETFRERLGHILVVL